jgi:protein-tyrosine phosphatase
LGAFTDLHCHLLPGIDDGVRTVEDGLTIARGLHDLGFSTIVATPHVRSGYWENTRESIAPALDALRQGLGEGGPAVHHAAENYFDDRVWDLFRKGELIGYGAQGKAALVEFPPQAFPLRARDRFFEMRLKGCRPVLAHPERYAEAWKRSDKLEPLSEGGAVFLVDLPSLSGKFGRAPRKTAERLLEEGLCYALCSDAHRPSDLDHVAEGIERARRIAGDEMLETLLGANTRRIFEGRFDNV